MKHVIALYLRKICDKKDWLFEDQHGFRPRYSCRSQVITVCQNTAGSLDNRSRIDVIITDFLKDFDFVHQKLRSRELTQGSSMDKGIPFGPYTEIYLEGNYQRKSE
jgi:hypothetical protein